MDEIDEEDKKIFINRELGKRTFQGASVEIIVPFYGRHLLVSDILKNIFNTVYSNKYLVTLVDDGSENKNFYSQMKKSKIPGMRCLRQESNKGFGSSINLALNNPWKFSDSNQTIPYVVILHTDVSFISKNWLLNLGNCLEDMKFIGVKMVSPLTDNPVEDFDVLKSKRGEEKENKILNKGFLPLYCALCHRDLFDHVGVFKEYPYAGHEAKEFANRMKEKGFNQAVCGNSWVQHSGRGTLKTFDKNAKVQKILKNITDEIDI